MRRGMRCRRSLRMWRWGSLPMRRGRSLRTWRGRRLRTWRGSRMRRGRSLRARRRSRTWRGRRLGVRRRSRVHLGRGLRMHLRRHRARRGAWRWMRRGRRCAVHFRSRRALVRDSRRVARLGRRAQRRGCTWRPGLRARGSLMAGFSRNSAAPEQRPDAPECHQPGGLSLGPVPHAQRWPRPAWDGTDRPRHAPERRRHR